jgi:hypothetical protein
MADAQAATAVTAPQKPSGLEAINTQAGGFMPSFKNFDEVWRWCDMVSRSNIVPKGYKGQPADIMVAVQFGAEIGLKWLQSLQSIAVVNGTPSIYGDAGLALVRSSGLLEEFDEWMEVDGVRQDKAVDVFAAEKAGKEIIAYCRSKRRGMAARTTFFGVGDAKSMKLWLKKGYNNFETPWCTSPGRMLMWRARGWNLRDNFGDVLKGLPLYEEAQDLDAHQPPTVTEIIAEKSQPETKGKQVATALQQVAGERSVPTAQIPTEQPTTDTNESVAPIEDTTQEPPASQQTEPQPEQRVETDRAMLATAISGAEAKLKSTQAGVREFGKLLGAMKVRLSGQQKPIDVLPQEQWEFYLDKLEAAIKLTGGK